MEMIVVLGRGYNCNLDGDSKVYTSHESWSFNSTERDRRSLLSVIVKINRSFDMVNRTGRASLPLGCKWPDLVLPHDCLNLLFLTHGS